MPIYEYRCEVCGHKMDHFHRSRSEPKPVCAACGEDRLERLVSLSSFHLKGSGWYATDYKSDKKQTNDGHANENEAHNESAATSEATASEKPGTEPSDSSEKSTKSKHDAGSSGSEGGSATSSKNKDAA